MAHKHEDALIRLCDSLQSAAVPLLGIPTDWKIEWVIREGENPENKAQAGECTTHGLYRQSYIVLYPDICDVETLANTMVHELGHIAHWPFTLWAEMIYAHTGHTTEHEIIHYTWNRAQEEYVVQSVMMRPDIIALVDEYVSLLKLALTK